VLDRMGFPWEKIHSLNPKMIVASIKGFRPRPLRGLQRSMRQCRDSDGGAASTTGFRDGLPLVTGAQIGDSVRVCIWALGIVTALYQRTVTGQGQKVTAAMQDGRLESGARQAARPAAARPWSFEGIQPVRRRHCLRRRGDARRHDSGGGQPGRILKCKGWETDPNAYIYFITQAPVWEKICDVIGEPGWKTHADYAKPPARALVAANEIFARHRAVDHDRRPSSRRWRSSTRTDIPAAGRSCR